MNIKTSKLFCTILAICSFSIISFAQNAPVDPALAVKVAGDKTSFKVNEQIIMKAEGFDEEKNTVQWQVSTYNKKWVNIPRATGDIYETYPISKTQYYRFITKPADGYLSLESYSKSRTISMEENVAKR